MSGQLNLFKNEVSPAGVPEELTLEETLKIALTKPNCFCRSQNPFPIGYDSVKHHSSSVKAHRREAFWRVKKRDATPYLGNPESVANKLLKK